LTVNLFATFFVLGFDGSLVLQKVEILSSLPSLHTTFAVLSVSLA
jgi:hypothetical protein